MPHPRAWVEISRRRLLSNFAKLRQRAPAAEPAPVVKADAYGHGALICAPALTQAGAHWLGVTGVDEGVSVRAVCDSPRILLMSGVCSGEAEAVVEHKLTPVVWEPSQIDLLEKTADGMAAGGIAVHLEIDTGMSRQGVRVISAQDAADALAPLLRRFHSRSPLKLDGIVTHFSAPGALRSAEENPQLASLRAAMEFLLAQGHRPQWLSAGNSTTLLIGDDRGKLAEIAARHGLRWMLRPGLALYGYVDRATLDGAPVPKSGDASAFGLEPVLTWKTRVTSLRTIRTGETAGYGNAFSATRPTRLALLPIGYADGVNRLLSNRGHVLLRGMRAPIAGRVSMDQTIVDVTGVSGLSIGDEAVLIGEQGDRSITAWEIADLTGSIPWETLCAIGPRSPRVAVD